MNDNRDYKYAVDSVSQRTEYPYIMRLVNQASSVIDLGCGDGTLLKTLQDQKKVKKADGIELSKSGVASCKKKGLNVWQGKIDIPLKKIKNKSYDYAICNVTLQMVMYPEILIEEMIRIAKYQIISFPNFAFFPNRLELLFKGRMPKLMMFGYEWYSTGEIHQFSIKDFESFCKQKKIIILNKKFIIPKSRFFPAFLSRILPNGTAMLAIYELRGRK